MKFGSYQHRQALRKLWNIPVLQEAINSITKKTGTNYIFKPSMIGSHDFDSFKNPTSKEIQLFGEHAPNTSEDIPKMLQGIKPDSHAWNAPGNPEFYMHAKPLNCGISELDYSKRNQSILHPATAGPRLLLAASLSKDNQHLFRLSAGGTELVISKNNPDDPNEIVPIDIVYIDDCGAIEVVDPARFVDYLKAQAHRHQQQLDISNQLSEKLQVKLNITVNNNLPAHKNLEIILHDIVNQQNFEPGEKQEMHNALDIYIQEHDQDTRTFVEAFNFHKSNDERVAKLIDEDPDLKKVMQNLEVSTSYEYNNNKQKKSGIGSMNIFAEQQEKREKSGTDKPSSEQEIKPKK